MSEAIQKVVLVTGAARGIGLATAKRFLADGWRVALLDIDGENLNRTYAALANPDATIAICCDVSDASGRYPGRLRPSRKNSANSMLWSTMPGIAVFKPILDHTLEGLVARDGGQSHRAIPVRAGGGSRSMRDSGGGRTVNITSISGLRASALRVAYGTSKAGLAHLTQQQAIEYASLGIRVNAVAPGPVDTAMAAMHAPEIRAAYHDAISLNRYGLDQELAEAIFFLCSDRASYITGQTLAVDGGFEATGVGLPVLREARRNS